MASNNENMPKAGDGDNIKGLSPPVSNVDKIIAKIRDHYSGRVQEEEEWWCIDLSRDEFKAFQARFKAERYRRWPKYDYFSDIAKFALRMPGTIHEIVVAGFSRLITDQLFIIEQSNHQVAANFARGIRSRGSSDTKTQRDDIHQPDASFAHKNAINHGVVLEVSHSQSREYLPILAEQYILGSDGLTQVVIGIDIEYRQKKKGKEARVMLWRPEITEEDGQTVLITKKTFEGIFRDAGGNLVNGEQNLQILLKDFGNKLHCPEIQDAKEVINISFAQLYEILQEGEDLLKRTQEFNGISEGLIKREIFHPLATKKEVTDSEKEDIDSEKELTDIGESITDSDEEGFKAAEEKVEKKLERQDGDYIPKD